MFREADHRDRPPSGDSRGRSLTSRLPLALHEPMLAAGSLAAVLLYLAGVPRWILLVIILAALGEQRRRWLATRRLHHPTTLITIGWILPYALTFLPLHDIVYSLGPPGRVADVIWGLFIVLFYGTGTLVNLWSRRHRGRTGTDPVLPIAPLSLFLILIVLSHAGFLLALVDSGFTVPLLQPDVTDAAARFFGPQGTASIFNLGRIAMLIGMGWFLVLRPGDASYRFRPLIGLLVLLYVGEQLLSGKRMGILLSLMSLGILFSAYGRLRPRILWAAILSLCVVVFLNAYLRAQAIFESAWRNSDISAFSDLWQFVLAQPAIYINETFANLGHLADATANAATAHRAYLWGDISEYLHNHPDDLFTELRSRGKMTTFLGPALASGGYLLATVWAAIVSGALWLSHAARRHPLGLLVYCYLGAHYTVLWTANFWSGKTLYYNLAVLCLLYLIVLFAGRRRVRWV